MVKASKVKHGIKLLAKVNILKKKGRGERGKTCTTQKQQRDVERL
jgi:hypothetical protein